MHKGIDINIVTDLYKQIKVNIFSDLTGNLNSDIQVLRKNGSLNNFFYCVQESDSLEIIKADSIINLCFVFNLETNYIILSELITERGKLNSTQK